MSTLSQRSFSSGEISPSLYARVDLIKYATGLRTCKNNLVLRYGGAANRAGTEFVVSMPTTDNVKLVPFDASSTKRYMLVFGDSYIRVIKDGVMVKAADLTINAISKTDPAVVTVFGHPFANGDYVYIEDCEGMTEVNGKHFLVANVTANTFELQDTSGVDIDATGYGTYTTNSGDAVQFYEVTTPYTAAQVADLKYVQSGNSLTVVHPSHRPRELINFTDTSWTFNEIEFISSNDYPTGGTAAPAVAGSTSYSYIVTAVEPDTGEESLAGNASGSTTITAISKATSAVLTVSSAAVFAVGDLVRIDSIPTGGGMEEINGRVATITNIAGTAITVNINTTNYTTFSATGALRKISIRNDLCATPISATNYITVNWTGVANAVEYNVYREVNGVYGLVAIVGETTFRDEGLVDPDTTINPPTTRDPFAGSDNYPSTVTYIQQRLVFGNTNNDTEKIWMSQTGRFTDFSFSSPIVDSDAITFRLAGKKVNSIKALVDIGNLIIFTESGEYAALGNEAGIITPTSINTKQYSYNGSGSLDPIVIDNTGVYLQSRGSIVRDFDAEFKGNDLTIFSAHLFDGYTVSDWAYQQIPHSILWTARSDGTLLGMTYVRNQEVLAWHRHEIGGSGSVTNVATLAEGSEDALYIAVTRTINGTSVKYIEKMTSRQVPADIADMKFMDSHLSYDGTNTLATTMTLSGGTTWAFDETLTLTSSTSSFVASDVGNAYHLTGASGDVIRATVTGYTSPTQVSVQPHKTVPAELRSTATSVWGKAVDEVSGLWHLEGEDVTVFGDGFVVANPNNASYDTVTVTNGAITLDKPYVKIHVGLPYLCDLETLDIDTAKGETLADKKKVVSRVSMFVEESRGIWVGPKPPTSDVTDPLENLTELKLRNAEDYDSPVALKTDIVEVNIQPEWNSNGRVFIRQVDPVPMTILSVNPAGKFPIR